MLILSLNFWRRAGSTCFVSRSGAIIFHSTEIKKTSHSSAMSPVTHFRNILLISITFLSRIAGICEAFPHSFLWRHFQLIKEQWEQATKLWRNSLLNGRCCVKKPCGSMPQQQHAPKHVDCEGPFITACSIHLFCNYPDPDLFYLQSVPYIITNPVLFTLNIFRADGK